MVNFRFHLMSLVAVFLSLAIGVSLGSGFVGEAITRNLDEEIDAVREQNGLVRQENLELRDQLEAADVFAQSVRGWMIDGALQGEDVVFVRFDHTDGVLTDAAGAALEQAGAEIAVTLTVNDKLALSAPEDAEELARVVGTAATELPAIRGAMAGRLGSFMAQAAAQPAAITEFGPRERASDFALALQEAGFLSVDADPAGTMVPADAMFVILGGGSAPPGFNAWRFATQLSHALLDGGSTVAVAERSASAWNLVTRLREDDDVSGSIVTVDHAESTAGQIALVLGLVRAEQGIAGHYGRQEGASGPLPEASLD